MLLHVFDSVLLWTSTKAFSMVVLLILQALIFHIAYLILISVRGMHMEGFSSGVTITKQGMVHISM